MTISSWMIRNRSLRSRVRLVPEDCYRLDTAKPINESAFDIFRELSSRMTTESRRLSLLNAFVKLIEKVQDDDTFGFKTRELLYCLSASLVHHFTQVRAGALRAIRYLLRRPNDIKTFNHLLLPHLVCRSLDVLLDNEEERVQALKLIRKMLAIAPDAINPILVRSLVALGEDGDRMLRACLATLCEFGVLNPTVLITCGGVSAITRNVLECHSPRIAESLVGVLLHLLEWPQTRDIAGVRLDCLAAPYCDFTYRLGIMDKNKDARDLRFTCSRLALLSVLRSWAGTIEFCNPNRASGLKAIVDVLYLNQLEVRKAILDLLYELLWLPQPVWTDEYSVALAVVDPADYQDSWRLTEGFVAMEGRNVLPSFANRVPNICEIHTALLLYCFLETGLLNALVEVVVSSDTFLSVRATVLIGKLLQLMHTHLPADILNTSSALPTLVSHATRGNHQAKASITALQKLHQMLRNRPAACSLFLDNIIQNGNIINSKIFKREIDANNQIGMAWLTTAQSSSSGERTRLDSIGSSTSTSFEGNSEGSRTKRALNSIKRNKLRHFLEHFRHGERLLRYSNVLSNEDGKAWDWEIIIAILKRTEPNSRIEDIDWRFIKRLVNFYKPSSNRFSHQDLGHGRHIPTFVTAGMELIDWLAQSDSLECIRLLTDLFTDINTQLIAISTSRSAHDCLFSPQHMSSTMCQQYFLFIGRMCRTSRGIVILNNTDIFKQLTSIVTTTIHVCYIKLIVSGLDYTFDETPRKILEKAMSASDRRSGRLYATQFMLVLLRARIPNFEVWGLPLLIEQTKDTNRVVALAALEILDEASHDRIYLEELVSFWPNFEKLDDAGRLIMTRYYSIPRGLNHHNAQIKQQISHWRTGYNKSYVLLLEADTHSILTLHTKNEDGAYSRRSCSSRPTVIPPNILPHLYGQLVQTSQGLTNLIKFGNLPELIEIVAQADCQVEADSLLLKSAIWAISHTATSRLGIDNLIKLDANIFQKFIILAKHCQVYSIRATALHALCLIGSTKFGADILYKFDWLCIRHDRDTSWPICEPEDWLSKHISPIRHPLDAVPPYNYKGIDENIHAVMFNNLSSTAATTLTSTDDCGTFYFDESSCDKIDAATSGSELDIRNTTTPSARSKTLPEGVTRSGFIKHTRSLSESKTTDGISLTTTVTTRTRFNSGTDSNTSGVSSCESVYGRYMLGEKHNTLSPIPSSSNLLEVKSIERFRRTSLTGASFRESTLSPQDVKGYAQLRKIRSNQRPMLSESAADELAEIMDGSGPTGSEALYAQQRRLKVRSLDRHFKACMSDSVYYRQSRTTAEPHSIRKITVGDVSDGPCYAGICLPKNIFDLFQTDSNLTGGTYVSRCIAEIDQLDVPSRMTNSSAKQSVGGSFPAGTNGFGEGELSSVSSMSDISMNSKRSRWIGRHNQGSCLHCCRSSSNNTVPNRTTDVNNDLGPRRKISNQSSLLQLSDISFNSLNSPESMFSDEYMSDKVTGNILRHVQRMANPVWSKQSKMALLEMKQKHPQSFQDICLYSEVCRALSSNTYRLYARRFLQELFLDLDFDSFNSESSDIIGRKEKELLSTTAGSTDCVDSGRTNGGDENVSNAEHIYANIKTHNRAPQLASVYETSVENLAESIGKLKHLDAQNHWRVSGTDYNAIHMEVLRDSAMKMVYDEQLRDPGLIEIWLADKTKTLEECVMLFGKPKQYSVNAIPQRGWRYDASRNAFNNAAMTTFDWVYDSVACVFRKCNRDEATSTTKATKTHRNSDCSAGVEESKNEANVQLMRPRFNTLELDLSCTKNRFPISDRRKQIEQQVKCSDKLSLVQFEWVYNASDNTFKRSSYNELANRSSVPTTPVSCDASLFCEKRFGPSKSEAYLSQNQQP